MKIKVDPYMKRRKGYSYINRPLKEYSDGLGISQAIRLPNHSYTLHNHKIITTDIKKAKKIDKIIKTLRW